MAHDFFFLLFFCLRLHLLLLSLSTEERTTEQESSVDDNFYAQKCFSERYFAAPVHIATSAEMYSDAI